MSPSPIHRDPEADGDDYGCFTDRNNRRVARVVADTIEAIESGQFDDGGEVLDYVRPRLQKISSATDTVVKENVFAALNEALDAAEIFIDADDIYGW